MKPKDIKISNFIITRFSVGYILKLESLSISQIELWFYDRLTLFKKYCYPSVCKQQNYCFTWLVFFDYRTPKKFIDSIKEIDSQNIVNICFTYFDQFSNLLEFNKTVISQINKFSKSSYCDILVTTRIDSDDMISSCFLSNINIFIDNNIAHFINKNRSGINVLNGYIYHSDLKVVHFQQQYSNPFITLVDSTPNPTSVFFDEHSKISKQVSTFDLNNSSFFFQVIHGGNVFNSLIGSPVIFYPNKLTSFLSQYQISTSSLFIRIVKSFLYYSNKLIKKV